MKNQSRRKVPETAAVALEEKAEEASRLLTAMANAKRLMVLCNLLDGERSVGDLADLVGLSSAALSQHLGKMRALDLVTTRRDGQTIYYRLASPEVREVLQTLYRLYCA
ncbi:MULTISPECIES: helix-turn-helix transcriptional regulator [unclassified Bradyrhizobium]|uniref:ArsR/SmtB family transcription factor n=1 Tax=unclassified Bradyrhizobium TaxID=2631580 RepID=UPI0004025904|nr:MULTISPECIES: metalloregulator ArsR/SmtB family transcription factor [unclassified Bradyrhizobium]MCP3463283.1 metalloregulator ArsR/SmtB family transcription factor [Bradyrhizobium sp. CCGUVB23]